MDVSVLIKALSGFNKKTFEKSIDEYVNFDFSNGQSHIYLMDMYRILRLCIESENNGNDMARENFFISKEELANAKVKSCKKYFIESSDDDMLHFVAKTSKESFPFAIDKIKSETKDGKEIKNNLQINFIMDKYPFANEFEFKEEELMSILKMYKGTFSLFSAENKDESLECSIEDSRIPMSELCSYSTIISCDEECSVSGELLYNSLSLLSGTKKDNLIKISFNHNFLRLTKKNASVFIYGA